MVACSDDAFCSCSAPPLEVAGKVSQQETQNAGHAGGALQQSMVGVAAAGEHSAGASAAGRGAHRVCFGADNRCTRDSVGLLCPQDSVFGSLLAQQGTPNSATTPWTAGTSQAGAGRGTQASETGQQAPVGPRTPKASQEHVQSTSTGRSEQPADAAAGAAAASFKNDDTCQSQYSFAANNPQPCDTHTTLHEAHQPSHTQTSRAQATRGGTQEHIEEGDPLGLADSSQVSSHPVRVTQCTLPSDNGAMNVVGMIVGADLPVIDLSHQVEM